MSTDATAPPPAPSSAGDPDMEAIGAMTSDLVSKGQKAPEHQQKIVQSATTTAARIDELRAFLDQHFEKGGSLLGGQPAQQPARQQVIDSVSGTVLHLSRIQSTFSLLADEGQEVVQKVISIMLGRLMAALEDFKKHVQYQNWAVSFTAGVPPQLQAGVQTTFQ